MKALSALGLLLLTANFLSAQEPLPAPWKHQDIGAAQVPGTAEHAAGVFTLQGTMDIWGKADGCHVAWQPLHGDGQLVARVAAMANPGGVAHAKASLTIRQSLDPGSPSVTLCVTATDGTQFLYRAKADGETVRVNTETEAPKGSVPKGQFPCWLKLVRQGREFRGYESTDGQQWQLTGQITLDLPADTVVALAASSHKPDVLTKATLDHVQLTLQPTSTPATAPGKRRLPALRRSVQGPGLATRDHRHRRRRQAARLPDRRQHPSPQLVARRQVAGLQLQRPPLPHRARRRLQARANSDGQPP